MFYLLHFLRVPILIIVGMFVSERFGLGMTCYLGMGLAVWAMSGGPGSGDGGDPRGPGPTY